MIKLIVCFILGAVCGTVAMIIIAWFALERRLDEQELHDIEYFDDPDGKK